MPGTINGLSLAYTAAGGIILWSGVKGETIGGTVRGLLHGKAPAGGQEPITGSTTTPTGTPATGSGDSALSGTAVKYVGASYVWGGIPGTIVGVDEGTDCSGFVNMCAGRDLGLAIPGYAAGTYNGSVHGPTSQLWLLWGGCTTIQRSQVQAGDLACWITHIGIFTDAGQHVVSALDPQSGVVVTTVAGATPGVEPLTCRRLNG